MAATRNDTKTPAKVIHAIQAALSLGQLVLNGILLVNKDDCNEDSKICTSLVIITFYTQQQ